MIDSAAYQSASQALQAHYTEKGGLTTYAEERPIRRFINAKWYDSMTGWCGLDHDGRFIKADSPAPFEDFFAPFITVARTQFWDALPAEMENCLEDTAKAAIERLLLNSIGRTFVPSLMLEFKVFRVQRNPMWAFGQPKPDGTPTRDTYKDFIRYMVKCCSQNRLDIITT